ncbi:amidoligase family protein [Celeribacter litoreus]|uniref:amidoligase family protein n=1 Tax=Celeribacter litoreus TaxID=2876714 RepID=UPI001CCAC953|nr:amidoligase family protein [Celeribacter litoreus]MCA0041893.1 amidoligase family protein [Celeribacter litoreus]
MTQRQTAPFADLPDPNTKDGTPRKTGVEIEFGALDERKSAEIVQDCLGGTINEKDAHSFRVEGSEIGTVKVYLDTAFRKDADSKIAELGLDIGRVVVPVEIVTDPLEDMGPLNDLVTALRDAGAEGSGAGLLYGYGVHFNPEVAAMSVEHIVPIAKAYALTEDFLRDVWPIDPSRHLLPFTDRYPTTYLDAIAGVDFPSLDAFMEAYLNTTPSRNRGLDLLPLLRAYDEEAFVAKLGNKPSVSARPTWHFRLPDCRIDEADWSLAKEWRRWVFVEKLAAQPKMLAELEEEWRAYRKTLLETRSDWVERVRPIVSGLAEEVLGDV